MKHELLGTSRGEGKIVKAKSPEDFVKKVRERGVSEVRVKPDINEVKKGKGNKAISIFSTLMEGDTGDGKIVFKKRNVKTSNGGDLEKNKIMLRGEEMSVAELINLSHVVGDGSFLRSELGGSGVNIEMGGKANMGMDEYSGVVDGAMNINNKERVIFPSVVRLR